MASSNFITDLSLTVSLSFFSLMSLTNDTLIHSPLYFRGPGVSVLMHLGWRASPPGPSRRSHTWESAPLLRMLFAQIAPFVFEYEMHFPNMTGDRIYPLREQSRCEGHFILRRDCLFISSLSLAVSEVLRVKLYGKPKNPITDARLSLFNGFQLVLCKWQEKTKSLNTIKEHSTQVNNITMCGIYFLKSRQVNLWPLEFLLLNLVQILALNLVSYMGN